MIPVVELETARLWLRQPVEADIQTRVEIPRDPEENRMYGGDGSPKTFLPEEVRAKLSTLTASNSAVSRSWILAAKVWPDGTAISQPKGRYIGQITIFGIDPDHRNAVFVWAFMIADFGRMDTVARRFGAFCSTPLTT